MLATLKKIGINTDLSHLNADAGFDVTAFIKELDERHTIIANIPKNKRNAKKIETAYRYFSEYIYSFRFKIELVFAWLDTYKCLLVRFEYRADCFKAWIHIAAALINLRNLFN